MTRRSLALYVLVMKDFTAAADRTMAGPGFSEKCADGSIHPGAVMGAVNHFVMENGLQLSIA